MWKNNQNGEKLSSTVHSKDSRRTEFG